MSIDPHQLPRNALAREELAEIAGTLMGDVAENNDRTHARILTLAMKIRNSDLLLLCAFALLSPTAHAVERITLHALFKDKAIVLIDGARRVLKTGDTSPEGVKLIVTDTQEEKAEIEVDGKRAELKLGAVISSFVSTGRGSVTLYPASGGHFFADGVVNGQSVRFLVDTGATTIALSGVEARRLNIDYQKRGRPSFAQTASGVVGTYVLKLDSVQIGSITLHNVDASIVDGAHPMPALLGMSFLGRLDMKREGDKFELMQR